MSTPVPNNPDDFDAAAIKAGFNFRAYHGTESYNLDGGAFRPVGTTYTGIYASQDREYAKRFGPYVLDVYFRLNNPLELNLDDRDSPNYATPSQGEIVLDGRIEGFYRHLDEKSISTLRARGFDGITVTYEGKPGFEVVAFEPDQVKILDRTTIAAVGADVFFAKETIDPIVELDARYNAAIESGDAVNLRQMVGHAAVFAACHDFNAAPEVNRAGRALEIDVGPDVSATPMLYLHNIDVGENRRGEGIASAAMGAFTAAADKHGVVAGLEVGEDSAEIDLVSWYSRRGFSNDSTNDWRRAPANGLTPLVERKDGRIVGLTERFPISEREAMDVLRGSRMPTVPLDALCAEARERGDSRALAQLEEFQAAQAGHLEPAPELAGRGISIPTFSGHEGLSRE